LRRKYRRARKIGEILKVLSNELRLSILLKLRDRQLSFAELMRELKLKDRDSSRFSYHLKMLCNCGLVEYNTSLGKYKLSKIGLEVIKWFEGLERVSEDSFERSIIDLDEEELRLTDVRSYVRELLRSLHIPPRDARGLARDTYTLLEKCGETIDSQDIQDVLRILFLRNGLKNFADFFKVIGLKTLKFREMMQEQRNVLLLSINVGLDAIKKYVMRCVLSDEILKMHLSGDITINDIECFSLTSQASLMDLLKVSESGTSNILKRIMDFALLSAHFSPHKSIDPFNVGLFFSSPSLISYEKLANFLSFLLRLASNELSLLPRSYSVTLVLDTVPFEGLDIDFKKFIRLTRGIIQRFTSVNDESPFTGIVLALRFKELRDLDPYVDVIYDAFKAHAPLVLYKHSGVDEVPYCGILRVPRNCVIVSTITLNMLIALINSNFDEELLYERIITMSKRLGEVLSTRFDSSSFENGVLVISVHGIDQVAKALTGYHVFESDESLNFAIKLAQEVKGILKEELEELIKLIYSLVSLDYRVYRLPGFHIEPLRSSTLRLLESVNITSVLPYNVDVSLDTRIRLESVFSKVFDSGSFLNIRVSEPFISREEFTKLLMMLVNSGISNFAITQDFTNCEICNSRVNDIHLRCARCSFHLGPSSHYGRILGYYDRLDRLPKLGRKEYYMRKKVSLVI